MRRTSISFPPPLIPSHQGAVAEWVVEAQRGGLCRLSGIPVAVAAAELETPAAIHVQSVWMAGRVSIVGYAIPVWYAPTRHGTCSRETETNRMNCRYVRIINYETGRICLVISFPGILSRLYLKGSSQGVP